MAPLPRATKRRDLINGFKRLGFTGPHPGVGDHPEYMEKDGRVVKLPNPHSRRSDIGIGLLKSILVQAGISPEEWMGGPSSHEAGATGTANGYDEDQDHPD